jgi:two-component system response regulator AlgR
MKVLVVDDEAPARERLAEFVREAEGYELAGTAVDGRDALRKADELGPAIVLLDIRMPDIDGIEAARHLAQLSEPPAVIFTTAYDQYTLEAFDAAAAGYILKPVRRQRLLDALERASRLTRAQLAGLSAADGSTMTRKNICARLGGRITLIAVDDIRYFRADQKYVSVRHGGGIDLIDEPLKELAREFEPAFVRIHRNALVAMRYVESVGRNDDGQMEVRLRGCDETLVVSRRHAREFRARVQRP